MQSHILFSPITTLSHKRFILSCLILQYILTPGTCQDFGEPAAPPEKGLEPFEKDESPSFFVDFPSAQGDTIPQGCLNVKTKGDKK